MVETAETAFGLRDGDAGIALLVLLMNVTLSAFKPGGMTPYRLRTQQALREASPAGSPSDPDAGAEESPDSAARTPRWIYVVGITARDGWWRASTGCSRMRRKDFGRLVEPATVTKSCEALQGWSRMPAADDADAAQSI